jgi:hypothetical protein
MLLQNMQTIGPFYPTNFDELCCIEKQIAQQSLFCLWPPLQQYQVEYLKTCDITSQIHPLTQCSGPAVGSVRILSSYAGRWYLLDDLVAHWHNDWKIETFMYPRLVYRCPLSSSVKRPCTVELLGFALIWSEVPAFAQFA